MGQTHGGFGGGSSPGRGIAVEAGQTHMVPTLKDFTLVRIVPI